MSTCIKVILVLAIALGLVYVFYVKPHYVDAVPVDNSRIIDSLKHEIRLEQGVSQDLYEELSMNDDKVHQLQDSVNLLINQYASVRRKHHNLRTELNKINNEVITDSTLLRFFRELFLRAELSD